MSKAILIMDMPRCCDECSIMCEQYYSAVKNKDFNNDMKPNNCPLREVPKEREDKYAKDVGLRDSGFIDGWNAFRDEILIQ